jgi:hypothetical protein
MSISDHKLLDLLEKCLEADIALKNYKKEHVNDESTEDGLFFNLDLSIDLFNYLSIYLGEYNLKSQFPKCVFWTYKCAMSREKTTRTRIPMTEIIENVLYFSIKREFYEFKSDVFPKQKAIVNHVKNLKETYQTPGKYFTPTYYLFN